MAKWIAGFLLLNHVVLWILVVITLDAVFILTNRTTEDAILILTNVSTHAIFILANGSIHEST